MSGEGRGRICCPDKIKKNAFKSNLRETDFLKLSQTRDARRPVSTDANYASRKGTAQPATVMERRGFLLRVWKNQPLYYTTSLSPSLSLAHSHRLSSRLAEMLPLLVVRTTAPPEVPLSETQLSAE